jgi:hypothetical protein
MRLRRRHSHRSSGSPLRGYPRDEGRERGELLLDEAARGLVLDLAGRLVELGRAIADEDPAYALPANSRSQSTRSSARDFCSKLLISILTLRS